jgi:uncharacterized protein (DUF58 family)
MLIRPLHRGYRLLFRLRRGMRHRITPAGGFVLAGLVLTAGASNPEQTLAMQAFLLLAALTGLSLISAPFFRARFTIERQIPRFITAGEAVPVRILIRNTSTRPLRGLEYIEDLRDTPLPPVHLAARVRPGRENRSFRLGGPLPPIRSPQTRPVPVPDLMPRGAVEVRIELVAWRRGPLLLAGGILAHRDPFGLFRAFRRSAAPQTVLVLPPRYPLPPLTLPGQSHYQRGGVAMAAGVGEMEEFVALREYRRGDSLRRVHWRSTARLGELVVKEFQDEYLVRHALLLDTFCEASRDALFEQAVAIAASFACTVPDQDSLLDLLFVGPRAVCVTSGRGVGHTEQMLEVLAAVTPERENRFAELESLLLRHRIALSGCLLVLLDWDEPRRALVRRIKALQLPCWVLLLVPAGASSGFDAGPPEDQPDRLILLEQGRIREGLQQLGDLP